MKRNLQIIVLAAGKGTRMKSELPKVLHSVCGRSLIERALLAVSGLNPTKITVVAGYGEDQLRAELDRIGIDAQVVIQAEQNGTGHAAQVALAELKDDDGDVLIVSGDAPLLSTDTLEIVCERSAEADAELVLVSSYPEDPSGFGRIIRDSSGQVSAIVEHRDCTPEQLGVGETNASVYLAKFSFLQKALGSLSSNNAQGELYLTDIVHFATNNSISIDAVVAQNHDEVAGANSRYELSLLEKARRAQINRELMESGVSMEDPAAAYIDEGVVVEPDSFIGAGTRLQGKTIVKAGAQLLGESIIRDSEIGTGTTIKLGCMIDNAKVHANCMVGPFAHLRPGSVLEDGAKVGNFVETKKAHLHKGVKASHLSYIGDAEVGEDANIGAGTITCNYDGYNKFLTVIEEGAFIGSNTALVAPVRVGARAVIGAGSTISKDVPADALGVERAEQKNIEGWAKKKRKSSK